MDSRWRSVLAIAPYVVLGLLVAFVLFAQWGQWARLAPTLALCAAYGLWVLVMRTLPFRWRDRPSVVAVFLTGAIALNLLLVLREGTFGFLAIATFSFAYSLAEWPWELLPVAGTAVVAGLAQSSGFRADPAGVAGTIAVVLLNVVVMCGLSFGLHRAEDNLHRTAVQDERARLAREIHDTLAQGFTGIITQLQAAEQASDDEARRRHTGAALALARDGLAEARRSVQALRPTALEQTSLADALSRVARSWSARTGVPATVTVTGTARPLPTETEVALLRMAQEALTNVEKHAAAHRVTIALRTDPVGVRLEVRDDGRGFDGVERLQRAGEGSGGYGLVSMRERLEAAAGSLIVEARPGRGTVVRAEVPA
ncbi:sensor histidine kinase [Microbacterium sp. Au-Mic1]|uniref:sensor histidine kinase n=1 Tax=Microbacterium sp. Au-Mic1 TaxID=2906457 RepID=UPI001E316ACC|nr:sensor histidine kinase [Microbacterium sp. Au-Mic1]MCE4026029.1 sensor histidine kinase [Microbacterium sp. Au-Mic1]